MVRRRNHRPAEFRGAILHTRPIAPVPDRSAKMRERCGKTGNFRLARCALLGVLALFKTDVTDEIHEYSLLGQMIVHLVPSNLARTDWSARKRWVFTVPSFIPVTSAISRRSMSSTNRSRNTVRCRAGRIAAAAQIACTCSWTRASVSGDCCRSGIEFPISATSAVGVQHPPPELQAAVGLVVSHQIGCDLHEPRSNAGSASKPLARLISLHKTVLRQVLGGFPVAQRSQDKSKNSRPVQPDQRIEFFQHLRAAFAGQ